MLRAASADELEDAMRPWVEPANNFVFADVRRHDRVPDARPDPGPARGERVAPGARLGRRARVAGRDSVRGDAGVPQPRDRLDRDRQQPDRRPRVPALSRARLRAGLPHASRDRAPPAARARHGGRHGGDARRPRVHPRRRVGRPVSTASPRPTRSPERRWRGSARGTASWRPRRSARRSTPPFGTALMRDLLAPILGPLAAEAFAARRAAGSRTSRACGRASRAGSATTTGRCSRPARTGRARCARALEGAVADLAPRSGPTIDTWRWSRLHVTQPRHPLSAAFPEDAAILSTPPRSRWAVTATPSRLGLVQLANQRGIRVPGRFAAEIIAQHAGRRMLAGR